ncbi:MAG: dihydroorotase [Hydrogenophilales bacterium 16-64-46]|nr:MAG: dihydroorotase [Hydrogenophilales bacterium 12-64-13]OYZ05273.1 MAG: dihydroorotase [Hydrogenophilales bacterium 16-64-46]OZA37088.1 MAG: dihydroorotase [Hydrogenophilales bacterium 17-64-34]HQS99432.1 dihydroorotase [Thiobacillus sp.]
MKIHIRNGRVVDPLNQHDGIADIYVAAGKIVAMGTAPADFHANRVIDASGLVVCPGLVDLSVRLREPGFEYRATLESEMLAAAAGGVTSLACPPDTDPPLDEPGLVEMLKFRAKNLPGPRVYPLGALTQKLEGKLLTEMAELTEAGCRAFTQADAPLTDTQVLLRAMEYAATFDFSLWLRPQDVSLARGGIAHDGAIASRLGLPGIPALAETVALATILQLARATGARVHLSRLSTRDGIAMVRAAKAQGLAVTCDVATSHVHLCENDLVGFDAHLHLTPPLRALRDRDAIREALRDGSIDALCSDHTPVDEDEKQVPFGESSPGASGVELLLPLTLKWARDMGVPLIQAIDLVSWKPAQILGVPGGHLSVGSYADICVFDETAEWQVSARALMSQGKNTPFLDQPMQGRVRYTIIDGHLDFEAP